MDKVTDGWMKGDVLLDILDFVLGQGLALAVTRGSNRLGGASGTNRAGRSKQEVGAEKLQHAICLQEELIAYLLAPRSHRLNSDTSSCRDSSKAQRAWSLDASRPARGPRLLLPCGVPGGILRVYWVIHSLQEGD